MMWYRYPWLIGELKKYYKEYLCIKKKLEICNRNNNPISSIDMIKYKEYKYQCKSIVKKLKTHCELSYDDVTELLYSIK